jgi:pre-mRNA-splicing factor CWC26
MGVEQKKQEKAKEQYFEQIKKEPFARYEIDKELDSELKFKERFGDPLLKITGKKRGNSKIECSERTSSNRYNIKAGKMWDGVDRSNGYEERLLTQMNEKERPLDKIVKSRPMYMI